LDLTLKATPPRGASSHNSGRNMRHALWTVLDLAQYVGAVDMAGTGYTTQRNRMKG
jgi:hypothetical protein